MLIDKESNRPILNELEPVLLQLPSTLPLDWLGQGQTGPNSLESMLEALSLSGDRGGEEK